MTKIKKQVEAETQPGVTVAAVAVEVAAEQSATGDGTGQALPAVDGLDVERVAPAIEPQAAPAPAPGAETVDVLVLCTGSVAGNRYEAGTVLEGVPVDVAITYAGMLDAHPDAAFYARVHGAAVSVYEG